VGTSVRLVPNPQPVIWIHNGGYKTGNLVTSYSELGHGFRRTLLLIQAYDGIYEVDSDLVKKLDTSYRKAEK
jgi:hypothetical protein